MYAASYELSEGTTGRAQNLDLLRGDGSSYPSDVYNRSSVGIDAVNHGSNVMQDDVISFDPSGNGAGHASLVRRRVRCPGCLRPEGGPTWRETDGRSA